MLRNHSVKSAGDADDEEILSGLNSVHLHGLEDQKTIDDLDPINFKSTMEIFGGLSVVKFALLENKRWVLVEDSDGNTSLWDILTVEILNEINSCLGNKKGRFWKQTIQCSKSQI